eukprot:UN03450
MVKQSTRWPMNNTGNLSQSILSSDMTRSAAKEASSQTKRSKLWHTKKLIIMCGLNRRG